MIAPSLTSHSRTSTERSVGLTKRAITSGKYGSFDVLFPLFDAMTQNTSLPSFLYYISLIFQIIQYFLLACWSYLLGNLNDDKSLSFFRKINSMILFVHNSETDTDPIIQFINLSWIFLLMIIVVLMEIASYRRTRTYSIIVLYILRIAAEILAPMFVIPAATFTGWCLQLFVKNKSSTAIFFMIGSIIYFLIFIGFIIISVSLFSISPFLPYSATGTWISKHYTTLVIMQSVFGFLFCFMENFPSWMTPVIIVIHIGTLVYHSINVFNLYFIKMSSNVLFAALFIANIITDVVSFIAFFSPRVNYMVQLVFVIISFIIGFILAKILMKKKSKSIENLLSTPASECDECFEELELKFSPNRALCYLHYGISEHCERVIDFSLQKYLASNSENIEIFTELVKTACLFPQESRLMNHLFQALISKKSPSYSTRFMLYQAERIKAVRQCSSSIDSAEYYQKVTALGQTCIEKIVTLWRHLPYSSSTVSDITKSLQEAENQWTEILNAYPNSNRFKEEYAKFLIECRSNFTGGILQKYFATQIENGITYSSDKAFKCFIRVFPAYLKKDIMDYKGNIIINNPHKNGSASSNSQRNSYDQGGISSSSSNIISQEVEENIGKSLINNSKTRIAIQGAFYHRASSSIKFMSCAIWFYIIVMICMTLLVYLFLVNRFDQHSLLIKHEKTLVDVAGATAEAEFFTYLHWADVRGMIENFTDYKVEGEEDYLFEGDPYLTLLKNSAVEIGESLSETTRIVSERSINDENIESSAKSFILTNTPAYTCDGSKPLEPIPMTFTIATLTVYYDVLSVQSLNASDFQQSKQICEIINNAEQIHKAVDSITNDDVIAIENQTKDLVSDFEIYFIVCSVGFSITCIIPIIVVIFIYYHEHKKIISLMRSFNDFQRQEAISAITLDNSIEVQGNGSMELDNKRESHFFAYLQVCIVIIIVPALTILNIYTSTTYTSDSQNILSWIYLSTLRKSYILQALSAMTLGILLSNQDSDFDPSQFEATNATYQFQRLDDALLGAVSAQKSLIMGSGKIPTSRGATNDLDQLNSEQNCSIIDVNETSHTFLKCGSITQQIQYLQNLVSSNIKNLTKLGGDDYFAFTHGVFNHIIPKIDQSTELFQEYADDIINTHGNKKVMHMVIDLIAAFIIGAILFYERNRFHKLYETIIHIALRMPPNIIANNVEMLNYFMKKDTSEDTIGSMSMTMKIIHNSNDAIICTGTSNDIEIINKSVTKLFGYTPEQVLGQNWSLLFDDQSTEEVGKQMAMMRNGQASKSYEAHVTCIADDDAIIQCKLTLVGMSQHDESKASSFVIILSDETELLKQKNDAEEAKKKSESLLYQILPMDIVLRLNQGEKNISFSVPFATVIFIDVQRFSEYAKSLSPSQIMGSLSVLFAAFDEIIIKYDLMTKIKLIGDTYMAASGLFSKDMDTKAAEQTVKFALDVIQELDEVNNKLGANLNVRIGINSGGPLIAGVLGTDKPAFDIIGDPINIAARLQSTDIAGKVQISQSTYDLTQNIEVAFEKRGEVFLKGKGKAMAYFVSQPLGFAAGFSSSGGFLLGSNGKKDGMITIKE